MTMPTMTIKDRGKKISALSQYLFETPDDVDLDDWMDLDCMREGLRMAMEQSKVDSCEAGRLLVKAQYEGAAYLAEKMVDNGTFDKLYWHLI